MASVLSALLGSTKSPSIEKSDDGITFVVDTTKKLSKVSHIPPPPSTSADSKEKPPEVLRSSYTKTRKATKNGFTCAAITAYNRHHHLVVRPEDVWMAIVMQFSVYLNQNSEKLRSKFVAHAGQKELEVYGGGNLLTADYPALCQAMYKEIAKNLVDDTIAEWAVPGFSTTTDTDRVVGAVVLMASMQKFFTYKMCLSCGLPKVTLRGTVDDWKDIEARAQRLVEFDSGDKKMVKWAALLAPVLKQFVATAEGNPDVKWWNRIANTLGGGSGPRYSSGWITVFCVFNDDGHWMGDTMEVNNWNGRLKSEWPIIDVNDMPGGTVSVPVTVDDNGTVYKTTFVAGHGAVELPDAESIAPMLEWSMSLAKQE